MNEYTTLEAEAFEAYKAFKAKDFETMNEMIEIIGKEYLKKYAIKKHYTDFYSQISRMK